MTLRLPCLPGRQPHSANRQTAKLRRTAQGCVSGLASSVWTWAAPIARLQYGCAWANTHFMLVSEMPHGGQKLSGYGKDMTMYGLEDYTVVRHVMIKHG